MISEPGVLRDRVEEAWQSVKTGLITGVSVGLRILDDAVDFMRDTGGLHVRKAEVLELSLVTVPSNQDATIHTIKQFDLGPGAAPGIAGALRSGAEGRATMRKSISEQIVGFRDQRKPKAERMESLMAASVEKGTMLEASAQQEYDGLAGEVEQLDAHISRLEALEKSQRVTASPVAGSSLEAAAASRAGGAVVVKDNLPAGIEFARYVICKIASLRGEMSAIDVAKMRYPDQPRIQMLLKAPIAGATTTDQDWAGALTQPPQTLVSEFIEFLRPMTILGKFGTGTIPSLRRVPFNVRITGQTSGGSGYWVGQAKKKPLTKFDFTAVSLYWAKVAAISVIGEELARFSSPSAEMLVRDALAGALVARLDTDFVDPGKAPEANVSPGSITHGIAPLNPSGNSAEAVRADVRALFQSFIEANLNPTTGVFIMTNTTALALSLMVNALGQPEFPGITMNGGVFQGLPVLASQYVRGGSPVGNLVILANAADVFLSDDGALTIDASREASLEMSDDPENDAEGGSPAIETVSMYQTNQIALRAERFINWQRRRDAAVAWLDNVEWGTGGSPS
jgi:HK97 family phage major capsid protein